MDKPDAMQCIHRAEQIQQDLDGRGGLRQLRSRAKLPPELGQALTLDRFENHHRGRVQSIHHHIEHPDTTGRRDAPQPLPLAHDPVEHRLGNRLSGHDRAHHNSLVTELIVGTEHVHRPLAAEPLSKPPAAEEQVAGVWLRTRPGNPRSLGLTIVVSSRHCEQLRSDGGRVRNADPPPETHKGRAVDLTHRQVDLQPPKGSFEIGVLSSAHPLHDAPSDRLLHSTPVDNRGDAAHRTLRTPTARTSDP